MPFSLTDLMNGRDFPLLFDSGVPEYFNRDMTPKGETPSRDTRGWRLTATPSVLSVWAYGSGAQVPRKSIVRVHTPTDLPPRDIYGVQFMKDAWWVVTAIDNFLSIEFDPPDEYTWNQHPYPMRRLTVNLIDPEELQRDLSPKVGSP